VPGAGAAAGVSAPGHTHTCVFVAQPSGSRPDEEGRSGCAGTCMNRKQGLARKQGVAPTWKGAVKSDLPSQLVFTCRAAAQPSAGCRPWRGACGALHGHADPAAPPHRGAPLLALQTQCSALLACALASRKRSMPAARRPCTHRASSPRLRAFCGLPSRPARLADGGPDHEQQQRERLQQAQRPAQASPQQQAGRHDLQVAQDLVRRGVNMPQRPELRAAQARTSATTCAGARPGHMSAAPRHDRT